MNSSTSDLHTSSNSKSIAKGHLKLVAASPTKRPEVQKATKEQRQWNVLTVCAGNGMSLPQYFINEPKKFLREFYPLYRDLAQCDDHDLLEMYYDDDLSDIDLEAFEIIENVAYIKLPLRYRGSAKVVQTCGRSRPYLIELVEDVNKGRPE